ncbi:MAG: hypothetical protein ACYC4L_22340 [Chloroflexota bacterium]
MNYRPRAPEGSDFARARGLLATAEAGRRCDLGPGCVPFGIDESAKAELTCGPALPPRIAANLGRSQLPTN